MPKLFFYLLIGFRMELAALIEDGLNLLYPSVTDVALLVERLLDQVQEGYYLGGFEGIQVPLLEQLMQRLAQQGQHALFRAIVTHHDNQGRSLLQRIFGAVALWNESLAVALGKEESQ